MFWKSKITQVTFIQVPSSRSSRLEARSTVKAIWMCLPCTIYLLTLCYYSISTAIGDTGFEIWAIQPGTSLCCWTWQHLLMSLVLRPHLFVVREGLNVLMWAVSWGWGLTEGEQQLVIFLGIWWDWGDFLSCPWHHFAKDLTCQYIDQTINGDTSLHLVYEMSLPSQAQLRQKGHSNRNLDSAWKHWASVLVQLWDNNNSPFLASVLSMMKEVCNSCMALLCVLILSHPARELISQGVVGHGHWNKRDQW